MQTSKKKKKALFVILAVSALTLYNILPTIFFYSNNLKAPISQSRASNISIDIARRVNKLEDESIAWINSYCKLLGVKAEEITLKEKKPEYIKISFGTSKEARVFRSHMQKAGNLIPFFPKRMTPIGDNSTLEGNTKSQDINPRVVILSREIPIHFDLSQMKKYFSYHQMHAKDGSITPAYRELLNERVLEISKATIQPGSATINIERTLNSLSVVKKIPFYVSVAETLLNYKRVFARNPSLQNRFYNSIFASPNHSAEKLYIECLNGFRASKDAILNEKVALLETIKKEELDVNDLSIAEVSSLKTLKYNESNLLDALTLLQNKKSVFVKNTKRQNAQNIASSLTNKKIENANKFTLSTGAENPIISSLDVDYTEGVISINLSKDLITYSGTASNTSKTKIDQLIFDEIAKLKNFTGEQIRAADNSFLLNLSSPYGTKSFLTFNLKTVAQEKLESIENSLTTNWIRSSETLGKDSYDIVSWDEFQKLDALERHFKLVLYSPMLDKNPSPEGFKNDSIYAIGKDLLLLYEQHARKDHSEETDKLFTDLASLQDTLMKLNARTLPGNSYPFGNTYKDDLIFEISDFSGALLSATREDWKLTGSKAAAILEFSNVRNRIIAENEIETKEHGDLLKWSDDYNLSIVNENSEGYMSIPSPSRSPFFSNLALSTSKYFRGDERKILHWGRDLNGGTTVRVALKDKQNNAVTSDADLNQGINELYRRVNKMGVSDVAIRKEGSFITLDFPETQSLSAAELITASSMTFHMVNEKFSLYNSSLSAAVNKFLHDVWNEALVTNKMGTESINKIAYNHLYGASLAAANALPKSSAGRVLLDSGLTLANPENNEISSTFNDKISKLAVLEGDNYKEWNGQPNPLLIVFNNYALEGSALDDVHSGYDPTSGNYLSFSVKSSATKSEGSYINPQDTLYSWTSMFSTSQMSKREYTEASGGNGWRLAAILNNKVISMPRLQDALKANGRITGNFSQKEVSRLAADLRAGSLTYTPEIISETTISPELGVKERNQGIFATFIAFIAVLAIMIGYYRFAGVIASIAVIFNILFIWATLQNLGASLTLAGIAGIILTIGMAVDANVLIFERIREENLKYDNLSKAIYEGYKKAFSAIFDSNITTIIAALILLNFDAGPIKGFALTLIIGIVSSMFTALYMTKAFFSFWLKKGKEQSLHMMNLIPSTGLKFMKYGKIATAGAVALIVLGGVTLVKQKDTLFGMDFTGGMAIELEIKGDSSGIAAKTRVEDAFLSHGFRPSEFSVRVLQSTNNLKIFLSNSLNNEGRPFAKLQAVPSSSDITYSYEKNAKILSLVNMLKDSKVLLTGKSLSSLDKNFSNISGQMSDTMRNNAILGLLAALGAILIYLTVRFEFSYAISATLGLAFDLLLAISFLGIFKMIGLPLFIDLNTIAALITIIGYSLNDTIIVFDRVRDDLKVRNTTSLRDVIDLSLNRTLSRTMMTSLTTFVVLLSLVVLGGKSIFGFSFMMMLGVIIGTLSTLFLSSTFLLGFKGEKKKGKKTAKMVSITS